MALHAALWIIGPTTLARREMTRLRAKKTPIAQTNNQVMEALATQFRKQNPEQSVRSMALKIGEKVKLKTNTVEKSSPPWASDRNPYLAKNSLHL
jgi:hypothetical protein